MGRRSSLPIPAAQRAAADARQQPPSTERVTAMPIAGISGVTPMTTAPIPSRSGTPTPLFLPETWGRVPLAACLEAIPSPSLLPELQLRQRTWTLLKTFRPPLDLGTMWSAVRSSVLRQFEQYGCCAIAFALSRSQSLS